MYKKIKNILLLSCMIFLMTGCCYINNSSIDTITRQVLKNNRKLYNQNTIGFKYYLPRNMTSVLKDEYNMLFRDKSYTYYMYTDLVSYYNKKEVSLKKDGTLFYSQEIDNGLINIIEKDKKYFIKVIYNYVTVEVETSKIDLKDVLSNALVLVKSVKYNDDAIKLLINNDNKNGNEEVIDIFHKDKIQNDYLEYDDTYKGDETVDYDPDVIN